MIERQDLAAVAGIGAGSTFAYFNIKRQGVTFQELVNPFRKGRSYKTGNQSEAVGIFNDAKKVAFSKAQELEVLRSKNVQALKASSFDGIEEAVRMGILETMSRPGFQSRINDAYGSGAYDDVFNRIGHASNSKTLKTEVGKLVDLFGSKIPEFESSLLSSIQSRVTSRYKGETYQSVMRGQTEDYTVDRVSGLDFGSPVNKINSRSKAIGLFGGDGGYWDKFEALVNRLEGAEEISPGYFKSAFKDGNIFTTADGSAYGRIKTKSSGSFNVPLKRNTKDTPLGRMPIYHGDVRGNTAYSFIQNFFEAGKKGLKLDPEGKPIVKGFEEAIFFGESPVILDAIEEAKSSNRTVRSVISGVGDLNPDSMYRFAEYMTDDISGQWVAMNRQSMAAVIGYKDLIERGDPSEVLGLIERQLTDAGYKVSAAAAPGAASNLGAFHVRHESSPKAGIDLLYDVENMAGERRPLQPLTKPWGLTNAPELKGHFRKSGYGKVADLGWIYNPIGTNPLYNSKVYEELARSQITSGHMGQRFASFNMLTLFNLRDNVIPDLNLSEGQVGINKSIPGPSVASEPSVYQIARPNEAFKNIKYGEGIGDLVDIANNVQDPKERRRLIRDHMSKSNKDWSDGYFLGQKVDPTRGLVEERLKAAGSGRNVLFDIEPSENGYKMLFQRHSEWGGGEKLFGVKGMTVEKDVESYAKKAHMGSLSSRVQAVAHAGELNKKGQHAIVRAQQATAMKHILANKIGIDKAGDSRAVRMLGSLGEYSDTHVFDSLAEEGAPLLKALGQSGTQRKRAELLGLVKLAFENQNELDSNDMGLIFGTEAADLKSSVFAEFDKKTLARELGTDGEKFLSRLGFSINNATHAFSESAVIRRDSAGIHEASRPSMERRGIESLVNSDRKSFVSMNGVTEGDILLDDIMHGIELPSKEYSKKIEELKRNYKTRGSNAFTLKQGASITERFGGPSKASRFIDTTAAIPGSKGVVIPSKTMLSILAPAIDTSGSLDPIETDYGRAIKRFVDVGGKWSTGHASKESLGAAIEAVRKQEQAMFHAKATSVFNGRIMHSSYEKIAFRGDLAEVPNMPVRTVASEGHGMVVKMSRRKSEMMFERAINHFSGDAEIVKQLKEQRKIVRGGGRGAMAVMRYPVNAARGRQLMGFSIDDTITDDMIHLGKRIVGGVDMSSALAMASSADADGDAVAYNLITGKHMKTALDMVNDENTLLGLAIDREGHVARQKVTANAIKGQISKLSQTELSGFVGAMRSLSGQGDIGMLSYNIDKLKYATRIAKHDFGGARLSQQNYEMLDDMLVSLEQEGIGFKHGKNVTKMITQDLADISQMSDLTEMKEKFESSVRRWFGDDVFGEGLKYSVNGEEKVLKFSGDVIDEMSAGFSAMRAPQFAAMHELTRRKTKDIGRMESLRYDRLVEYSSGEAAELMALGNHVIDDLGTRSSGMAEDLLSKMNAETLDAARNIAKTGWSKLAPSIIGGLAISAGIYSLFDRGYSNSALEAPGPSPDGRNGSTSIGMRMAIQGGELLREERGGPSWNRGQNQQQQQVPGPGRSMPVTNSIPQKTYVAGNTGRINISAQTPQGVNPAEFADSLRVTMPHAQVGVNMTQRHIMPRDIGQEI